MTADGSSTLQLESGETYHSIHGALTESRRVYLELGLEEAALSFPDQQIRILEIGLGTGLNAALSLDFSQRTGTPVEYLALEPYPIPEALHTDLVFPGITDSEENRRNLKAILREAELQIDQFRLRTIAERMEAHPETGGGYHLIYMDAFSPGTHPEAWTQEQLAWLFDQLLPGGILTTFCVKGVVRRAAMACGFETEKLPGPVGGKREVLRLRRPGL